MIRHILIKSLFLITLPFCWGFAIGISYEVEFPPIKKSTPEEKLKKLMDNYPIKDIKKWSVAESNHDLFNAIEALYQLSQHPFTFMA